MYKFGESSKEKLATCHPQLQLLMNEVIKHINICIIFGERGELEQNVCYKEGRSKLKYPMSKHNKKPSQAVDVMLWNKIEPHIRWNDRAQIQYVVGYIKATADQLGIKIKLGADWNGDLNFDEAFYDPAHIELEEIDLKGGY